MSRIKDHIFSVAGRYKGKIYGWDVVNEALNGDGSLRESGFLKIAGPSYIQKAFEFAHEADPQAELYYNDYNMVEPAKRAGAIALVKKLQKNGVRIDGVGMQAHWELNYPSLEKIEQVVELIDSAKKPFLIFGQGIQISKAQKELKQFIDCQCDNMTYFYTNCSGDS